MCPVLVSIGGFTGIFYSPTIGESFNSMEESIKEHSDLLVNNYQKYVTTGTIEDWCDALIKGKYATASNYKETILQVCRY